MIHIPVGTPQDVPNSRRRIVSNYQWLAKAGLALVDVIAIGLAIWHFYAKHVPLKVWCYIADGVIAVMMNFFSAIFIRSTLRPAQKCPV